MPLHVCFRQLDTYGEGTDGKHHSGYFQGDGVRNLNIVTTPRSWVEDIRAIWTCLDELTLGSLGGSCLPMTTPNRNAQMASPMYNCTAFNTEIRGEWNEHTFSRMKSENMPNYQD